MKREFLNYKTTTIWRFFFFFDQLQVSWHAPAGCSGLKWSNSDFYMLSTATAFQRYQEIRHKLPTAPQNKTMLDIENLTEISGKAGAFVFDAFGVLNVGDCLIEGADQRLSQLRQQGCEIRILTNAARYDSTSALEKFDRLGVTIDAAEIIPSREATITARTQHP